jgi:fatty-acyl-CoA synthase
VSAGETLPGLLAALARADPGGTAAVFGDEELSYARLDERSSRVAEGLHREGVRPGDPVAVWLPNGSAWIELQFALAKLGALLVCVNTRYRSHELAGVLTRSRARWLVLQPEFRSVDFLAILDEVAGADLRYLEGVVVCGEPAPGAVAGRRAVGYEALGAPEHALALGATGAAPCVAFTSSGSTGAPKLIAHGQRGIVEHARAVADAFFDGGDAVALVTMPLSGVFGYATFMGALAAGRPAVVMEAFDADAGVALVERHAVTTVTGPDEVMLRLLDAAAGAPERIATWREGGFGAQSVDSDLLITRGDAAGVRLFGCYGSSECLGLMSRQPRRAAAAVRALGGGTRASPRTLVRAVSPETGAPLPHGTTGLLEITGPNVMQGYLNQPDATAAAFTPDGWFRTGDLGYVVDDERFVFLSRANDVLRLAGFLVEPREIEAFVERLDSVAAAQVVEVSTDRGARAVAFVIPAAGVTVHEDEVVAHCAASLAKYKVPVRVVAVAGFPTTPSANGDKVQRAKLRELADHVLAADANTPRTARA